MGFFDKLMKGGAPEEPAHKAPKEKTIKKPAQSKALGRARQTVRLSAGKKLSPVVIEKKEEAVAEEKPAEAKPIEKPKKEEADFEGELAIDVYETDGYFVVQSTIAGVKAEDLDITIENDIVTIRGKREKQITEDAKKYYYRECYWGTFSRQVILPEEVDGSKAEAAIKDGVLTLKIPKLSRVQKRKIAIKQIE